LAHLELEFGKVWLVFKEIINNSQNNTIVWKKNQNIDPITTNPIVAKIISKNS